MLLIDLPVVRRRATRSEFSYGGEAHIARPLDTDTLMPTSSGRDYLFMRKNPRRRVISSNGCTPTAAARWFNVGARYASRYSIRAVLQSRASSRRDAPETCTPIACGGAHRPRRTRVDVHVQRPAPTRATPATRSPPRCWPTASPSSRAASSTTGRAASSAAGVEEPNAHRAASKPARSRCRMRARPGRAVRRPRRAAASTAWPSVELRSRCASAGVVRGV